MADNKRNMPSVKSFEDFFKKYKIDGYITANDLPDLSPYATSGDLDSYVKTADIVNDLTTGGTEKPLSAEMGKSVWDTLDMEYGEWTPTIANTSGTQPTVSYNSRSGYYYKIGRCVFLMCNIYNANITNVGSNQYACISGIPYSNSINNSAFVLSSQYTCFSSGDGYAYIPKFYNSFGGTDKIMFYSQGGSSVASWKTTTIGRLYFNGIYITD